MIGGPDIEKLEQYAKAVMADLRKVPGAVDVDSSLSLGKPQFGIAIDRAKAAELGVSVADIANTLRLLVAGDKVSDYNEKGEQYEVHVRSIADVRNRLDELKMITVPSSKFGTVPLGDVVRFEQGHRPGPDQPPRPHPAGHDQRQPDARHLATDGARRHRRVGQEARTWARSTRTGLLGKSKEMAKAFRGVLHAPSSWPSSSSTCASPPSSSRGCTRSRSCCRCR